MPWTPCFPGTGGWCGPPGHQRCQLLCGRRVVETSQADLRHSLNAGRGGGGRGRGYRGGQDRGYGGGGVGLCALDDGIRRMVEVAAMKAISGPRQKPRWEKEKQKRLEAETKLAEMEKIKKVCCSVTGVKTLIMNFTRTRSSRQERLARIKSPP